MDVHRRTAVGRYFGFLLPTSRQSDLCTKPFKGKPFAGAVFDGVRILKLAWLMSVLSELKKYLVGDF
jgi:hypothetical protein